MSENFKTADEFHNRGFNCAQAVVMTYCESFSMDKQTAMRASEAFGGGMGCFYSVCGALSGVIMLCGLKNGGGDLLTGPTSKAETYAVAKNIVADFERHCGALNCRDIKAGKTPCAECIRYACELAEKYLF